MKYCDVRRRIIKFKCGHVEEVQIWQNWDIEGHFKDKAGLLCSKCGSYNANYAAKSLQNKALE